MEYPSILGIALVGEVTKVSSSVPRFSKGNRVIGHAKNIVSNREFNKEFESAFQTYNPGGPPDSQRGATSVGSNAIRLGVAAGYDVTTASPKNFDCVKQLGAGQAFDFDNKTITDMLVAVLEGKTAASVLIAFNIDRAFQTGEDILF
ncbi:hypothetical protein MMC06_000289 [Schaereria dolodes]|nr:hypothetical protein [Schaereria dolodes]